MKHAGAAALDQLELLLGQLRGIADLQERSRGIFYRRSKAFLHFHEDPAGLFADLAWGGQDVRLRVSEPDEQRRLLEMIRACLVEERG